MTEELRREYFNWMYNTVYLKKQLKSASYVKLLSYLNEIEFIYDIPMDGNRYEDGIDLRYRFCSMNGYKDKQIAIIDDRPCSFLEMMVALAIRVEEHIMCSPEAGDRTGQWFWGMIDSLGLLDMDDKHFDKMRTFKIVSKCLNHEYEPNGRGGLFTINNPPVDIRTIEIWYQLNIYLDDIL